MEIIKIEKNGCVPCKFVGQFLKENAVPHTVLNIENTGEEADRAFELLGDLGLTTVPVTILSDGGNIVDFAHGADIPKIEKMVEKLK